MNVDLEFETALKRACLRAVSRAARYEPMRGGDQTAVQYGPLIGEIADEADLSVSQTRRRLQALQAEGKVIRDDRRGGSTAWWLVGLIERPCAPPEGCPNNWPSSGSPSAAPTLPVTESTNAACTAQEQAARSSAYTFHKTLTHPAVTAREHWSDVLGVARDCSTSDARTAFRAAMAAVNEVDLDAVQQRKRIHMAYSDRLKEDGISEYE